MTHDHFLNPRFPTIWHGGDYNPEQWPESTWDEDMRLMRKAHFHVATIGVFSWAKLEPEEDRYDFSWMDSVIERLGSADRYFILSTPSAAPPAWMSRKYPEILRTGPDRVRRLHGNRVNYSLWSPVYREKTQEIARRLAERYGSHSRLLAWHVSNEFGGEDYGSHSIAAFRRWLREKYGSLDALNAAYWTAFWSHVYSDWEEIDAPGHPYGETAIQGLAVDWQRFTTDSTLDFMLNEASPLREISPGVPVTTNLMGTYPGINYRRFTPHLDFTSWDSYPAFGQVLTDPNCWVTVAFKHDLTRCLSKTRRWMMMECSPSSSNWYKSMALKKPGMHRFEMLQAIAHGADGVQYFQWRQSRGSQEQLHGAVVNHGTTDNGRVFREVQQVGEEIDDTMAGVAGSRVEAEVAVIYDWEAKWSLDAACGPIQGDKKYEPVCVEHYRAFWEAGIPVDVIGLNDDLSQYKLVVAPMAYAIPQGFAERVSRFVEDGGTFVTTYLSGWTDENSLVFEEGFLGPLRKVLGIWSEEIDALDANTQSQIRVSGLSIDGLFEVREFCEQIHLTTAKALGSYQSDFYAGNPALTVNPFGAGKAYYVASRNETAFTGKFLQSLAREAGIERVVEKLPVGVTAQRRVGDGQEWIFLLNATPNPHVVTTKDGAIIELDPWDVAVRSVVTTETHLTAL
ncbi:MAG TPA: beta-galactosidase [Fimbriimonas sp.]|nr:beta-galactosidase [Fimbriimonas sp.]